MKKSLQVLIISAFFNTIFFQNAAWSVNTFSTSSSSSPSPQTAEELSKYANQCLEAYIELTQENEASFIRLLVAQNYYEVGMQQ